MTLSIFLSRVKVSLNLVEPGSGYEGASRFCFKTIDLFAFAGGYGGGGGL